MELKNSNNKESVINERPKFLYLYIDTLGELYIITRRMHKSEYRPAKHFDDRLWIRPLDERGVLLDHGGGAVHDGSVLVVEALGFLEITWKKGNYGLIKREVALTIARKLY